MPTLSKPGETRRGRNGVPDTGAQTLDLDTAVKNGVFGGGFLHESCKKVEKKEMKKMIEQVEQTADVPSVFICPISLQPMQDPVTLCTGQTYDRCNILKWLSIGHRTCPTTMQELWDVSFVPNTTLHHLINTWFSQKHFEMVKTRGDVQGRSVHLLTLLKKAKGDARIRALKELNHLVTTHQTVKKTVIESGGLQVICSLLGPFTSHAVGSESVSILLNLSLDSQCKTRISHPAVISLIADLMNEGCCRTKINCARMIQWVMKVEGGGFDPYVVSSMSLMAGIVRLVRDERRKEGAMAGLKLMKTMCGYAVLMRSMVRLGGVRVLMERMDAGLDADCVEICVFVLECLSSIPEGVVAMKKLRGVVSSVGRMVMKGSEMCTGCAVSILMELCRDSVEDDGVGQVVEAGIAAKLLLVLQSGYGSEVKRRCAELLKMCSLKYNDSFFISKCRLTRTIR